MYIILYLARGIPRKVMNPVEHEATPSMIDMRSYFMGASHAYRWALTQFTSFTRDHSMLWPFLCYHNIGFENKERKGKKGKERKGWRAEGDKRVGAWEKSHRIYWLTAIEGSVHLTHRSTNHTHTVFHTQKKQPYGQKSVWLTLPQYFIRIFLCRQDGGR